MIVHHCSLFSICVYPDCFPPDIGQGVNSALEDIYVFQEILAETQDNLSEALPRYQNLRQPDIKALIRLVQISYPWQYNQDPLQKRLWSLNFFLLRSCTKKKWR